MSHLKVIQGIKKEKPDYFGLYSSAFINELESANEIYAAVEEYSKDILKKLIWSGVKMIIASESRSNDKESLERKLSLVTFIDALISMLTPKEFENIFPLDKEYNGEKWGTKDYFYSRKYIENFGEDRLIGKEIDKFLWKYNSWTIGFYVIEKMGIVSDLRKLETGQDIFSEFLEEQGVSSYTMYEGDDGKKYLENNQTGEVSEVKKPKPRYLKLIK